MARAKRTTSPPAKVVGDQIERPHSGKSVRKVGPQTHREAQGLSGNYGPAGPSSVRQIGPGEIPSNSHTTGKVTKVGEPYFTDKAGIEGVGTPYSRQSGSVRQVGPPDRSFTRLTEGTGSSGSAISGRVLRSNIKITGTPLLKSGVGVAYQFGLQVGQPGTSRSIKLGATKDQMLVNGRRRKTPPAQPDPSPELVTPTGPTIL